MHDIIIFGCGGFGREVLQIIHGLNTESPHWNCLGFATDPGIPHPETVHGLPVQESIAALERNMRPQVAIAIASPCVRKRIAERLTVQGYNFPTLIHPRAWIGKQVSLSEGVIVCAGASLSTDICVGAHVHINLNSTIGHDAVVGAYSTISPGVNISGNVVVDDLCEIGTGAAIIPGVKIGCASVIGAGAAVIREVPSHCTAVGVPARVVKRRAP